MILASMKSERIGACKILVVGDVILDRYWFGNVSRISGEAPVPIVHIHREEVRLGGAANVAHNIKKVGAQVTLLTVVGKDDAGKILMDLFASNEITAFLSEDETMQTVVKLRIIGQDQQMIRVDFENEPDHELMAGMVAQFKELVREHDIVIFSDYGKGGLTHITRMIRIAKDLDKPILIDPKGIDWDRYYGATVITPNLAELTPLIGPWSSEAQLESKIQALIKSLNLQALLLTRSREGMTLFEAERAISIRSEAVEVADVSGAGDTVIAILAVMMACRLDLAQSMTIANRAAGQVVAKFGTASVSYDELFDESHQ